MISACCVHTNMYLLIRRTSAGSLFGGRRRSLRGTFGRVRTKVYLGFWSVDIAYRTSPEFGTAARPYRTFSECSVRPRYPQEHSGKVRYELDTGTPHFGDSVGPQIPVPDTLVLQRYFTEYIPGVFTLRKLFGTAAIPCRNIRSV